MAPRLQSAVGLLVAMLAASVGRAEAEEEVEASRAAVSTAATVMGAITFQMILFYFTNHTDEDIRKYTYQAINTTISIFSAVLLFSTFNDQVEYFFLEETPMWYQMLVDMLHQLVWVAVLQFVAAYLSGHWAGKDELTERERERCECFTYLLAHMVGFASINAWGALQQMESIKSNSLYLACTVPLAICGQFLIQRATDQFRESGGKHNECHKVWDEVVEEAENDVMGLTVSFLTAQWVRHFLSGYLPNQEGQEPWPILESHSLGDIGTFMGIGVAFLAIAMGLTVVYTDLKPEHKAEEAEAVHDEKGAARWEFTNRVLKCWITTFSMAYAWCIFFCVRYFFATMSFLEGDRMMLAVVLAMYFSLTSFALIWVLDKLVDADFTQERADNAIKQVIASIGILIGFSWEQCFDQAVSVLASVTPRPHLAKAALAVFTVLLIVPAWARWIFPMVIRDGWKFGFVIDIEKPEDHDKWKKVVAEIDARRNHEYWPRSLERSRSLLAPLVDS